MGKHSGRHAFKEKLKELGYDLGDNALEVAFTRFKDLADRKKVVYDDDIVALVDDEIANAHERIKVVELTVIAGTKGPQIGGSDAGDRRRTDRPIRPPATARWTRSSTPSTRWPRMTPGWSSFRSMR